jgi:LiaF transmembrane domain/Cell wall-active antibiotics response LiaF, C-terminal
MHERAHHGTASRLILGATILVVGVLLTLDHLDVLDIGRLWDWWPTLLIAFGVAKLAQPRGCHSRGWGAVEVFVGLWWLLYNLGVVAIGVGQGWPILLVLLGANILWRGLSGPRPPRPPGGDGDAVVSIQNVFGGTKQRNSSQAFQGGTISAVFGSAELDLRLATIKGDEAVVDVSAVFGGIEIRVPETWTVVLRASSVLGGVEDKTHHREDGAPPRLVVTGGAVFGGIEIAN